MKAFGVFTRVPRRTPMSYTADHPDRKALSRRQRAAADLCINCGEPTAENRVRCQRCLVAHAAVSRENSRRLKLEVLEAYGGAVYACCGETCVVMLTLDHINQDAAELRRKARTCEAGHNFYHRLKKEKFPPGFRVLCMSCNFAVYHSP